MIVNLPWPDKVLNPNSRAHWRRRSKVVKTARTTAKILTLVALGDRAQVPASHGLKITMHPPDARRRDQDNAISSCKSLLDGVADALGVNDSRFVLDTVEWGDVEPGGRVAVRIGE